MRPGFSGCVLKAFLFPRFKAVGYCNMGEKVLSCSVQSLVPIASSSMCSQDSDKVR